METLYNQTNKLVIDVQNRLSAYEKCDDEALQNNYETQIKTYMDEIFNNCDRLDLLVNKEPPPRRANAKLRVDQIKYDCRHMEAAFQTLKNRKLQKKQEEKDRELLMSKVFTPNGADTAIMIDASLQHNQRVQASIGNIDELIYAGNNILSNLKEQGGFLKSFQRKILDISNMLGLSNTVMRMIERRSSQDKIILFGGMIATSFIMLLLYIYFLR